MSVMPPQSEESKELRQACHELRSDFAPAKQRGSRTCSHGIPSWPANDEAVLGADSRGSHHAQ